MTSSIIEKNKLDNTDLLQMEEFFDIGISKKDIIVIEPNDTIAITIGKFLRKIGFENIHRCKKSKEGTEIFSHFIYNDTSVPIIIDIESNKKVITKIQKIQPNATIIIMTSKEKTDPEILKLFDIGISSILHKPLVMEDFEKSFPDMVEKNQEYVLIEKLEEKVEKMQKEVEEKQKEVEEKQKELDEKLQKTNNVKDLESLLLLHNQITHNKFKDIHKLERSKIEEIIKNALDNKTVVFNKEISEAACNQCNSTNITYTSECPMCESINFKQKDLIEHYSCGGINPKETEYGKCTKCNKKIGTVGKDYREFKGYHICSSCDEKFEKPSFKFICLDCGNIFLDGLALWEKSKIYKIQK